MSIDVSSIFSTKNQYRKNTQIQETASEEKKKCGVLGRVSTDMQAVDGDSLEMQQELAQEHIDKINGELYKTYIEEGLSASKIRIEKRQKIQELMEDIREGKVNYVIAYKRDRMFRNSIEHMQFLQFLVDHNCDIYFSARGEIQLDLSGFKASGVSKMMESMLSMMAEMESAVTSARVSDTMISKAYRGERTGGRLPFGYEYEGEKIIPIEGAKEIVQIIEDLYLSGYGIKSISKWLNGGKVRGLKKLDTPYPKLSNHCTSKEWNHRNVETILFNPIYTGHNSYQSKKNIELDRIIEKSSDVVPMRTIERQQQIFEFKEKKSQSNKPPRAYNTPFLLTGIAYCAECGSPMKTQTSQKREGVRYSYYKCGNRHTDKAYKCSMSRIYRKEILERMIIELTKEKLNNLLDENVYEIYKEKSQHSKKILESQIETIKQNISKTNKKIKSISGLIVELDGESEAELKSIYLSEQKEALKELSLLKEKHLQLIAEKDNTDEEKTKLQVFIETAKKFSEVIANAPTGRQKQYFEILFNRITINKEGEVKLDFNFGVTNSDDDLKQRTEEGKLKTPSFISLGTIREGTVPKHINGRTNIQSLAAVGDNGWTLTFNYPQLIGMIYEQVRVSFYPFLCHIDPKFDLNNAHLISKDDIVGYTIPPQKSRINTKKLYMYIEQKLGVNKSTRTKIVYGHLPTYEFLVRHLEKLGTNLEEFLSFVKSRYPDFFISPSMFEDIEASVNSKTVKTEHLFKDKIKCHVCGCDYVGKKEGKGVRYKCIKNRADRKKRCNSFRVKEQVLIEMFENDTNKKITRQDVLSKVDYIAIPKNDHAIIYYHEK